MNRSILIVAGETSGDLHGSELVKSLKREGEGLSFFGIGGDLLGKEGVELLYHTKQMHVTGFTEVVRRLSFFRKAFSTLLELTKTRRPDLAILIDYPGFNLRLITHLKKLGIPICYYIAPQVWAWKESRVELLRKVDELIVIFPFEVPYFKNHGVDPHYFGHPLVNQLRNDRTQRSTSIGKSNVEKSVIGYLPGSRENEVRRHLPVIKQVINLLGDEAYRHIVAMAPGLDSKLYSTLQSLPGVQVEEDSREVLHRSRIAVAKSGTSTVEAMILGIPSVVIYKTSWLSSIIARSFAKVRFISMINILAGKKVVEELVQGECRAERIREEVQMLESDPDRIGSMKNQFLQLTEELSGDDPYSSTSKLILSRFFPSL